MERVSLSPPAPTAMVRATAPGNATAPEHATAPGNATAPEHATERDAEAVRALARVARILERSCGGISLAHYRVLAAVASGDERASRLATRLAVGKPAISAAVDALCSRGMLERTAVAGDLRAASLRLTRDGEALLADVERQMHTALRSLLDRTPNPDRVRDCLVELGAAVDALHAEHHQ
jgi:DNA-binding MarR family transcriptional regulator